MLQFIATPVGNLGDLTPRALDALRTADVIACEDTRRTWALLSHFGIPRPRLVSYRQGNEARAGQSVIDAALAGQRVAVCSDGGYPGISDPGYRLIAQAVAADVPFEILPGASAVPLALLYSGLPTASYTFKGFPPRKPGPLRRFFEADAAAPHTLIVFESPYRLHATLAAAHTVLGNRRAAVCLELTKRFERIHRGTLDCLAAQFEGAKPRGEATLVVEGRTTAL